MLVAGVTGLAMTGNRLKILMGAALIPILCEAAHSFDPSPW